MWSAGHTDSVTAGEEDLVPADVEQGGGAQQAAADHVEALLVQVHGQVLAEDALALLRDLAGLDHRAVSGDDGTDQRVHLMPVRAINLNKPESIQANRALTVSWIG